MKAFLKQGEFREKDITDCMCLITQWTYLGNDILL